MLMDHLGGSNINQRMFWEYLLSQGLKRSSDLSELYENTLAVGRLTKKLQNTQILKQIHTS